MNWDNTRRTLLERLRRTRTDEAGWYDFFDTYSRLIYSVARKSGLGHSDAEDMVQSTTLKVAQYIQRFEINPGRGKGSLRRPPPEVATISSRRYATNVRKPYDPSR